MDQNRSLHRVLSDILTHHGAILEEKNDGSLEFLSPPSLSETLGISEHGILSFSYHPPDEEIISASYESELFRSIEKLFWGRGAMAMAAYPSILPNIERLSKVVEEKIVLSNATFRLRDVEIRTITYLLTFFKYVALSDEKKEGLLSFLVNELNLSIPPAGENLIDIIPELKEVDSGLIPPGDQNKKAVQASFSAASAITREELSEFIKSLERRLNRDIKRVFDYYDTLRSETENVIERRALLGEEDGVEKLAGKVKAIEAEKMWKIQDIVSKYALNVRIEPVSAVVIETESPIFWIEIKRRLLSRQFPVTYNPLTKRIDPLPCEACFYPRGAYYLCDEKLHILCGSCFKKCPECGRPYCSVCYKRGCPKCEKRKA